MTVVEAYGDIAKFLAQLAPNQILSLKANDKMASRVEELIARKKEDILSEEERIELERYLSLDLLINLTKARAISMNKK